MRPARLAGLWLAALAAVPALAQAQAPLRESPSPSIAAPALQDEIRPRVIAAAKARLADPACDRSAVAETAFNGWSGASVAGVAAPGRLSDDNAALRRPWEETWIVDLCGRIVDVLVLFTPGPQGIAAAVPAHSVHLRP